jgi:hypothetical protein
MMETSATKSAGTRMAGMRTAELGTEEEEGAGVTVTVCGAWVMVTVACAGAVDVGPTEMERHVSKSN